MNRSENSAISRSKLERQGSLHWIHWTIITFSLMLTIFAWYFAQKQLTEKIQIQFERESQQVIDLVLERMKHYEDALSAGAAMIKANGYKTDYQSWTQYVDGLQIVKKYPGINGIGIITRVERSQAQHFLQAQHKDGRPAFLIHPKHNEKILFPITYIIPVKGNEKAVGLDIAHETNRFRAALKAQDTGRAQITGPITLIQDKTRTPGFLFYEPYYNNDSLATVAQRQKNFLGLVYAPFVFNKLMNGVLSENKRLVAIKVSDGKDVLFNELTASHKGYVKNTKFKIQKDIELYGRIWTFDIQATKGFILANSNNQPLTILIGGVCIDLFLLILFIALTRGNRLALAYADEMTKALQKKTNALEASNHYKSEFLANMSHELRTPLNSILLLSSIMADNRDKDLNKEKVEMAEHINTSGQALLVLINDVLDQAKIESGTITLNVETVNLSDFLQAFEREFSPLCHDKGLKLITIFDSALPESVVTDKQRISQIIKNFVSNAIKFTSSGFVEIRIGKVTTDYQFNNPKLNVNNAIAISVSDSGIGIADEAKERVFESFQQADGSTSREYGGTGLGLSISSQFAELLGGEIGLQSELGSGSTFTLYIGEVCEVLDEGVCE